MPKPHPIELRERVVAHVEAGHSHRKTASHFRVSVKFVNDNCLPEITSSKTRMAPASFKRAIWLLRSWSTVETRA